MTAQRPEALIYHFSPAYRLYVADLLDNIGYEPRPYDDIVQAYRAIGSVPVVITAREALRQKGGDIVVDNRTQALVGTANSLNIAGAVLDDTGEPIPTTLQPNRTVGGEVLPTHEAAGLTAEERFAQADQPGLYCLMRVGGYITPWLMSLNINR